MLEYPIVVYEERNYCIYAHVNKINNKKYIGQTGQNPEMRWGNGRFYVGCPVFFNAIEKYGWDGFNHIIVQNNLTRQEANLLEWIYIKALHSKVDECGYNIKDGGDSTPSNFKDITGQQFGRLTALYRNGYHVSCSGKKKTLWRCICSCDKHNEIDVMYDDLVRGNTTSCGCIQWENRIKRRPNEYEIDEKLNMVTGYTKSGVSFIFDLDDYDRVQQYTWHNDKHRNNITTQQEINGHRTVIRIINVILDIINQNNFTPQINFINGNKNDFRKQNLEIIIPDGIDKDEYDRYVKMGGVYHVAVDKQTKRWRVYYDNAKHSKSFNDLDSALSFWKTNGDKPVIKQNPCVPIICVNSLEIISGGAPEAVQYTNVKRPAISHSCTGVNEFGGRHLVTGEKLKWMRLSDYELLSDEEKENLKQKYFTGNKLVSKEEL